MTARSGTGGLDRVGNFSRLLAVQLARQEKLEVTPELARPWLGGQLRKPRFD
jgi:hypothetical protein